MKSDLSINLKLIQRLITQARTKAYTGGDTAAIAEILDTADYLIGLLAQGEDRVFRASLGGLEQDHPELKWIFSEHLAELKKFYMPQLDSSAGPAGTGKQQ